MRSPSWLNNCPTFALVDSTPERNALSVVARATTCAFIASELEPEPRFKMSIPFPTNSTPATIKASAGVGQLILDATHSGLTGGSVASGGVAGGGVLLVV